MPWRIVRLSKKGKPGYILMDGMPDRKYAEDIRDRYVPRAYEQPDEYVLEEYNTPGEEAVFNDAKKNAIENNDSIVVELDDELEIVYEE